ncbi:amidinotransferase [Stieleria marina]|uniref:Inosamine-phosphate amidinotransferase 1 n=1 Tax=Stieleria marina TaxID=1930275 RepID=A0A517P0J9_9BACT|nr:Inosamine-phosphate amidinotransferase 1 [Planctomycetes bacterium K23_9]
MKSVGMAENQIDELTSSCPVNSHNEWDPLEEVIIGSVEGAMFPEWKTINEACVPPSMWDEIVERMGGAGVPYSKEQVDAARQQLAGFIHILEQEGVNVRRLDQADFASSFATPSWQVSSGFCSANPRDPFIVIGNEIIEAPMADRSRYYEAWAYRSLFKEYFKAGAKWTSAPRPQLLDDLYDSEYECPAEGELPSNYLVTEFEPVFDAADFVRCGEDIFCQKSHVTNQFGIDWLQRHLGDRYRIHLLKSRNPMAIHIDTTFLPLAPGKVLVNPEHLDVQNLPSILDSWDILVAPDPIPQPDPLSGVCDCIAFNVLMLDEERVVVEERQEPLIKALKEWGFKPIPCAFHHYFPFLGAFHCATLDVRRRGELKSYF